MPIESPFTHITDLNVGWPLNGDALKDGNEHIQGLKTVLTTDFPNINAAVTADPTELNYLDGTTPGTAVNNKALVVDGSRNIGNLGTVTATNLAVGTVTTGSWEGTTIAVDQGGTGQTSYTNGQLLIGNTTGNTLAKTTLTAGNGIDITNGAGSITVTAETANATNPGVVELATTAETTTGTDATRAVTPDGLKDGYQGSANITTVGTISSGVWQGTPVTSGNIGNLPATKITSGTLPLTRGGLGATTKPTARSAIGIIHCTVDDAGTISNELFGWSASYASATDTYTVNHNMSPDSYLVWTSIADSGGVTGMSVLQRTKLASSFTYQVYDHAGTRMGSSGNFTVNILVTRLLS